MRLRGLWGGKRQVCRGLLLHRMMLAGGTDDGKDAATGREERNEILKEECMYRKLKKLK